MKQFKNQREILEAGWTPITVSELLRMDDKMKSKLLSISFDRAQISTQTIGIDDVECEDDDIIYYIDRQGDYEFEYLKSSDVIGFFHNGSAQQVGLYRRVEDIPEKGKLTKDEFSDSIFEEGLEYLKRLSTLPERELRALYHSEKHGLRMALYNFAKNKKYEEVKGKSATFIDDCSYIYAPGTYPIIGVYSISRQGVQYKLDLSGTKWERDMGRPYTYIYGHYLIIE